jgi:hypothetical protein
VADTTPQRALLLKRAVADTTDKAVEGIIEHCSSKDVVDTTNNKPSTVVVDIIETVKRRASSTRMLASLSNTKSASTYQQPFKAYSGIFGVSGFRMLCEQILNLAQARPHWHLQAHGLEYTDGVATAPK